MSINRVFYNMKNQNCDFKKNGFYNNLPSNHCNNNKKRINMPI